MLSAKLAAPVRAKLSRFPCCKEALMLLATSYEAEISGNLTSKSCARQRESTYVPLSDCYLTWAHLSGFHLS